MPAPRATNHHSAVTTAVTRTTGSTATACATSSHSPGSDAVISLGRGRPPSVAFAARERTVAIRQRSRSANQRAGARAPTAGRGLWGRSKPTAATHRPPSTSSRPATAITGAVSRYSDSTRVRRPVRKTNLAPGRHRPPAATGNDSAMTPRVRDRFVWLVLSGSVPGGTTSKLAAPETTRWLRRDIAAASMVTTELCLKRHEGWHGRMEKRIFRTIGGAFGWLGFLTFLRLGSARSGWISGSSVLPTPALSAKSYSAVSGFRCRPRWWKQPNIQRMWTGGWLTLSTSPAATERGSIS